MQEPQKNEPPVRGDVIRIIVGAVAAALAAGFIAASMDGDAVVAVARTGLAVALVALLQIGSEIRTARRLARLEDLIERGAYWKAYSDAFADLSGGDGEITQDTGRR